MAENRPLEVLQQAALEDARDAAALLVNRGWDVAINQEMTGPGIYRMDISIALPVVKVHAQAVEAKGFDWDEPSQLEASTPPDGDGDA